MMHNIYITENYDAEASLVYQAQIRDEDLSSTDRLTDWLNVTLVNLYLDEYSSQYDSGGDEYTDKFVQVSEEVLKSLYNVVNGTVDSNDTAYIYGDFGCIYVFKRELYKAPYYKDV